LGGFEFGQQSLEQLCKEVQEIIKEMGTMIPFREQWLV
jgi:hypothetical protein